MTVSEILAEIKSRAVDPNLGDPELLTRINNEYDQTNLAIINLNEDYFFTEKTDLAITSSLGPYNLPSDFSKFRALIPPSGSPYVSQVSPADDRKPYGWYLAGTTSARLKRLSFTQTPHETGNYTLRYCAQPPHLDLTTNTVPLWPESFDEILILGALKRTFSIQDLYDKFPDLKSDLKELRQGLLTEVGGLNLGANRDVDLDPDDL
jgi:hypothetical protein